MSVRPVSVPVLIVSNEKRVRRGTARSALASTGVGLGGVGHPMTPAWKY